MPGKPQLVSSSRLPAGHSASSVVTIKEGYLEKKASSGWKSWKKRWFRIEGSHTLAYTDSPDKAVAKGKTFSLVGATCLWIATDATGTEFAVSVVGPDGGAEKKMLLRSTEGPSVAQAWFAAFEAPGIEGTSPLYHYK